MPSADAPDVAASDGGTTPPVDVPEEFVSQVAQHVDKDMEVHQVEATREAELRTVVFSISADKGRSSSSGQTVIEFWFQQLGGSAGIETMQEAKAVLADPSNDFDIGLTGDASKNEEEPATESPNAKKDYDSDRSAPLECATAHTEAEILDADVLGKLEARVHEFIKIMC